MPRGAGRPAPNTRPRRWTRSEEHTSELRHVAISYAVFCLKKKKPIEKPTTDPPGVSAPPIAAMRTPAKPDSGPSHGATHSFGKAFAFFLNDTTTTEIYTLSLHDALPILAGEIAQGAVWANGARSHMAASLR